MSNKYNVEQNKITKESIFAALMVLMEKKNFKDISITEVTKKAGVSRMAFYRNYNILEDIIVGYLDDLFGEYSNNILNHTETSHYEITRLFFYCFRQHKKFIDNLFNSNLTHLILERSVEFLYNYSRSIVCKTICSPELEKYNITFVAGGVYNVLIEWSKGGMKESDEEMAEIVYERLILK